uniref:VPS9 domain-containing protein n=1 Tax=Globisporangium ultimum (strain ATCC 200006 / CBS 805.95 / DAOM BR144) TaxID=431595 RepID=K3WCA6_GLOUD
MSADERDGDARATQEQKETVAEARRSTEEEEAASTAIQIHVGVMTSESSVETSSRDDAAKEQVVNVVVDVEIEDAEDEESAATVVTTERRRKTSTLGLQIDTSGGRGSSHHPKRPVREKISHGHSMHTEVGAPSVWISPDWVSYPIIENFYGQPRRTRVNSFYEVMCSPTNHMQTTTLGENCCAYDVDEDNALEDHESETSGGRRRSSGLQPKNATTTTRRKLGSFAYSCSTEASDDIDILPSPFGAGSLGGFSGDATHRNTRGQSLEEGKAASAPTSGSGFAAWNRIRRTVGDGNELVPVPVAHTSKPGMAMKGNAPVSGANASRMGNPQAGSAEHSPTESFLHPESPPATPPTTSRLRSKLKDSLYQIDERIQLERQLAKKAQSQVTKVIKQPTSAVWNLICGARTSQLAQTDGLSFLHEQLSVAVHNRALNQLQRHRRHMNGILQIVTSHNPDLELTEKQLDSFETAEDMLGNDVKYSLIRKQVEYMEANMAKRKIALVDAKLKNGTDCFDLPRARSAMLVKLLEAVSWYRLVQTNSREESASTSVVAPLSQDSEGRETVSSTSSSQASTSRSLQEIQVEKILNVLAGEEFYSDYNELMCKPDWWEIAQAHFENLVFSKVDSRVCQWMNRMSRDVAAVSEEALEDTTINGSVSPLRNGRVRSERRQSLSEGQRSHSVTILNMQAPNWASNPQPEQILDFVDRFTRRIRREFDVPNDVNKSLNVFIQRTIYPRVAVLCYNQKAVRDCQRKDKLWRKKCVELSGVDMEKLNVPAEIAEKIRAELPCRRISATRGKRVYLVRAIEAFNGMSSIVPCDLLEELMHGVVILHHEAALVLGTTQFSVETFFPLLAYVLLHCQLPRIHAQLHLLENYAITNSNVNGEESYYVYCVHAAVEFICNSAGLSPFQPKDLETKRAAEDALLMPIAKEMDLAANSIVHPMSQVPGI